MGLWDRIRTGISGAGTASVQAASAIDYSTLVERAANELRLKTEAAIGLFRIDEADWSVDLDRGTIVFTSPNGLVATASVQAVGTVNTRDSTWLWGWANPTVPEAVTRHARLVRDFGQRHGIRELTERKFVMDEGGSEVWRFTALACHLGGAQGAYRGPAGATHVFMTFGPVSLAKGAG